MLLALIGGCTRLRLPGGLPIGAAVAAGAVCRALGGAEYLYAAAACGLALDLCWQPMLSATLVFTASALAAHAAPLRTRAAVRPALRQGAALAVGLAGGWAVLYGALLPFGPGLALGLGEDCFAASAAGAALGLLLHGFGALSLQSICLLCGLGAIVAGRWLWPGRWGSSCSPAT